MVIPVAQDDTEEGDESTDTDASGESTTET